MVRTSLWLACLAVLIGTQPLAAQEELPAPAKKAPAKAARPADADKAPAPAGDQAADKQADAEKKKEESWRMKRHNGRWWYWMPDEHWKVHVGGQWIDYDPATFQQQVAKLEPRPQRVYVYRDRDRYDNDYYRYRGPSYYYGPSYRYGSPYYRYPGYGYPYGYRGYGYGYPYRGGSGIYLRFGF